MATKIIKNGRHMTISDWLKTQKDKYKKEFLPLDAELILCFVLSVEDRSYLTLHEDQKLTPSQSARATGMLEQRIKDKMPLAYVLQEKEFYGRKFYVDSSVLIPRPETEGLIDIVKEIIGSDGNDWKIVDIGTGSSCIATTLKLELPKADVIGTDISPFALKTAKMNAKKLGAKITFTKTDLFEQMTLDAKKMVIVANLPYVDPKWDWVSKENLQYEPEVALYAEDGGLSEILRLLFQILTTAEATAKVFGKDNAGTKRNPRQTTYVVLELDPSQKARLDKLMTMNTDNLDWGDSAVIDFQKIKNLASLKTTDYAVVFKISII
ncbi:peptide chain release factor N(5)-glutamine methyltransferase [Candidatus Saccharibacteria bacterium]|nr:peptide chain release factor N(5)-glutamine methyltransferase [Candidatus Saccharibacteria bacterium]